MFGMRFPVELHLQLGNFLYSLHSRERDSSRPGALVEEKSREEESYSGLALSFGLYIKPAGNPKPSPMGILFTQLLVHRCVHGSVSVSLRG